MTIETFTSYPTDFKTRHIMIKRLTTFIWLAVLLLSVTGCDKSNQTASSAPPTTSTPSVKEVNPVDFFGVDLRTVARPELETLFYQTLKTPLVPRNDFESVADASKIFPGAEKIEVTTTRSGALATMQFVFPGKGDPRLVAQVAQLMESRYGKPSATQGKIEQGEYRALWDKGGNFIIQVGRGWPDTTVYLNFVSATHLTQLREDLQEKLSSPQNMKSTGL